MFKHFKLYINQTFQIAFILSVGLFTVWMIQSDPIVSQVSSMPVETELYEISGVAFVGGKLVTQPDLEIKISVFRDEVQDTNIDLPILNGHNPNKPVGKITKLQLDGNKLLMTGLLYADTVERKQLIKDIQNGLVRGLSVSLIFTSSSLDIDTGRLVIYGAELREISITPTPAILGAKILMIRKVK